MVFASLNLLRPKLIVRADSEIVWSILAERSDARLHDKFLGFNTPKISVS